MQETENTVSTLLYKRKLRLMGNSFEISVVSGDAGHAEHCIDAAITEISRIEKIIDHV